MAQIPSVSGITPVYSPLMGYSVGSSTSVRPCVVQVLSRKFPSSHSDSSWFSEVFNPEKKIFEKISYYKKNVFSWNLCDFFLKLKIQNYKLTNLKLQSIDSTVFKPHALVMLFSTVASSIKQKFLFILFFNASGSICFEIAIVFQ